MCVCVCVCVSSVLIVDDIELFVGRIMSLVAPTWF